MEGGRTAVLRIVCRLPSVGGVSLSVWMGWSKQVMRDVVDGTLIGVGEVAKSWSACRYIGMAWLPNPVRKVMGGEGG